MNMHKVEEADGAGGIVLNINITDLWWRGKIWVAYPGGIVRNINITDLWWRGKIWVAYPGGIVRNMNITDFWWRGRFGLRTRNIKKVSRYGYYIFFDTPT